MIYLSNLRKDLNESEKIRFYYMMTKLTKLKNILESEPNNQTKIIKKLLISEGILDKKYFKENIINNLIKFIKKKNSILNPSDSFKNNLLNIMNNNHNYNLQNFQKK